MGWIGNYYGAVNYTVAFPPLAEANGFRALVSFS